MNDNYLDAKGLNCPLPLLKMKRSLVSLAAGDVLVVDTTDPGSKADFAAYCKQLNHELMSVEDTEFGFQFKIRKG